MGLFTGGARRNRLFRVEERFFDDLGRPRFGWGLHLEFCSNFRVLYSRHRQGDVAFQARRIDR